VDDSKPLQGEGGVGGAAAGGDGSESSGSLQDTAGDIDVGGIGAAAAAEAIHPSAGCKAPAGSAAAAAAAALPVEIASLSAWRHVSPVDRTVQVLGITNCPRLRMLRDVTFGDGSLARTDK
jgi:hypothetical protein